MYLLVALALAVLIGLIVVVSAGASQTNQRQSQLDCFVNSQASGTNDPC